MNITIQTIPKEKHLYPTCGDYRYNAWGDLDIRVSDLGDEYEETLVAIHEIIEAFLCKKAGIKEQDITDFDIEFEKNRKEGNTDEPGDSPLAPYKEQHAIATNIEKQLAYHLGIAWSDYEEKINST